MPANSSEYQKAHRKRTAHLRKVVSVSMSPTEHRDLRKFAASQKFSMSELLREASLHQLRNAHLKSPELEEEIRELKFLISNIANNINQMAHHSNRLRKVTDENSVLERLQELDQRVTKFIDTRMSDSP